MDDTNNMCSDEYAKTESLLDDKTSKMVVLLNWSYDKALSGLPLLFACVFGLR